MKERLLKQDRIIGHDYIAVVKWCTIISHLLAFCICTHKLICYTCGTRALWPQAAKQRNLILTSALQSLIWTTWKSPHGPPNLSLHGSRLGMHCEINNLATTYIHCMPMTTVHFWCLAFIHSYKGFVPGGLQTQKPLHTLLANSQPAAEGQDPTVVSTSAVSAS